MGTATDILLRGADRTNQWVGPAIVLLQDVASYDIELEDGTGYPEEIEDVIDLDTGEAVSGHGWEHVGLTAGIAPTRSRDIVQHDADQAARTAVVHDVWEDTVTFTAVETTLTRLAEYYVGHVDDPSPVPGAPDHDQTRVRYGDPAEFRYRRMALVYPTPDGKVFMRAYRKVTIRPTGTPEFSRTGRWEHEIEATVHSDTRIAEVNERKFTDFLTNEAVLS